MPAPQQGGSTGFCRVAASQEHATVRSGSQCELAGGLPFFCVPLASGTEYLPDFDLAFSLLRRSPAAAGVGIGPHDRLGAGGSGTVWFGSALLAG